LVPSLIAGNEAPVKSYSPFPTKGELGILDGDGSTDWTVQSKSDDHFFLDNSKKTLVYEVQEKAMATLSANLPTPPNAFSKDEPGYTVSLRLRCSSLASFAEHTLSLLLADGKRRYIVWFKPGSIGVQDQPGNEAITWHDLEGDPNQFNDFAFSFNPLKEELEITVGKEGKVIFTAARNSYTEECKMALGAFNSRSGGEAEIKSITWSY